jgi:acetyl-CoA carboxylase biotin carboxyl carrier protein
MNVERIEAVLQLLQQQAHVGEVEVEGADWKLRARRIRGMAPAVSLISPPEEDDGGAPERQEIRAGMVGIYRAPKKPLRAGDFVTAESVVGNIDSMRILNAVTALQSGYLVGVLVEDGDAVEYGQTLFVLDAAVTAEPDSRSA